MHSHQEMQMVVNTSGFEEFTFEVVGDAADVGDEESDRRSLGEDAPGVLSC